MKKPGTGIRRAVWWTVLCIFVISGVWLAFYGYSAYSAAQSAVKMSDALAPYRTGLHEYAAASQKQPGIQTSAAVSVPEPTADADQTVQPREERIAPKNTSSETQRVLPATTDAVTAQEGEPTAIPPNDVTYAVTPDPILAVYRSFADQNPDMAGWIAIPDTVVDYPVMYTPGDPQKYLHKDFQERYSFSGLPFLDARCDPAKQTENSILYAHNMRSGQMFATLHQYLEPVFLQEHPTIHYDTLTATGAYEVFAVLQVNLARMDARAMRCYTVFDTALQDDVRALNDYLTEYAVIKLADAQRYDSIVTLSTCQHLGSIDRLVVMARRGNTEAETAAATLPGATVTEAPKH